MAFNRFTAGQKLRADELNKFAGQTAFLAANVDRVSSTVMANVTGLSFALEANATYGLEGYLAYYALDGVDVRWAWSGPAGMTARWGMNALATVATTSAGDLEARCFETYGDANFTVLNSENDTALSCVPGGYFATAATAGTLQARFCQNVANGTPASITAGTWLRLTRLA